MFSFLETHSLFSSTYEISFDCPSNKLGFTSFYINEVLFARNVFSIFISMVINQEILKVEKL